MTASADNSRDIPQGKSLNTKSILFKFTILSVSLILVTGTSVSPALPLMGKDLGAS
ncbi:hypothetical protein [Bifidobacterium subtile]|uniref:Uncharacterized protein n=1 Tax=Bifidobacterium subtile TaxID=77635 RepID=A0A087E7B5_9BIFI|nr:hypothetical protein [Bifidobacterium subtile]KFJ03666.1 hypothetical protein BISU_0139 [Bifidobacterium subtile]QOL36249.1 hypothetical protein BS3272_10380 [Bifidobacterium subtile]